MDGDGLKVATLSRANPGTGVRFPAWAGQSIGLDRALLSSGFLRVTSGVGKTSE